MRPVTLDLDVLVRDGDSQPWPGVEETINFNDAACPSVDGDNPKFIVEQGFVVDLSSGSGSDSGSFAGNGWEYFSQDDAVGQIQGWADAGLTWHAATKIFCSNDPDNFWVVSNSFYDVQSAFSVCCGAPTFSSQALVFKISNSPLVPGQEYPCTTEASFKWLAVRSPADLRNLSYKFVIELVSQDEAITISNEADPGTTLTETLQEVKSWPADFIGLTIGGTTLVANNVTPGVGERQVRDFDFGTITIKTVITDTDLAQVVSESEISHALPITVCDEFFTLMNAEGDTDLVYPLDIFDTTVSGLRGAFLGTANNDAEALALLQSSTNISTNQGNVKAVNNRIVTVVPISSTAIINFYALEFYTMRSSVANMVIHCDDNDVVHFGATALEASAVGVVTAASSVSEYNGTWGITVDPSFNFRRVTTTAGIGVDVHVSHSRTSRYVGHNVLTPITLLSGKLPAGALSFLARGPFSLDLVSNVTNWSQLTVLQWFNIENIGGGVFGVNNYAFIPQPPPSVKGLCICDIDSSALTLQGFGWITAANFPNMERLKLSANGGNHIDNSAPWFATCPLFKKQLIVTNNNTGEKASASNANLIINSLWAQISSVIPSSPASIRLEDTTNRTAASDASFNAMDVLWSIALT